MKRSSVNDMINRYDKQSNEYLNELHEEILGFRGQTLVCDEDELVKQPRKDVSKKEYDRFLIKYEECAKDGDAGIFTNRDLVYFFRQIAWNIGLAKHSISNFSRDVRVIDNLIRNGFSKTEICTMIEFLFCDKQKYLDYHGLGIYIFQTGWLNTIYQDSQLWRQGKYKPRIKKGEKTDAAKNNNVLDFDEIWKDKTSGIGEWQ
jgi:hypothetical protein